MRNRFQLFLGLLILLAAVLTFYKVPLASSQGLTLYAASVTEALPLDDPEAQLWNKATAVEVPLSAQNISAPMQMQSTVKSVTARALQNENQVAVLVEWADATQDDSTIRVQDFRDAAALQFPLAQGQPYFCMGQQGGNVNIWHWKADWQADIAGRQDMDSEYPNMYVDLYPFADPEKGVTAGVADYSDPNYVPAMQAGNLFASPMRVTPVEDLIAGGFGSLTAQASEAQNVQGFGRWRDGKWQVIFSRDLASNEADDIIFNPGKVYSLAFAVWDGANGDRNGQKSTSQWVSLQLAAAQKAAGEAPAAAETASPWTSPLSITLMIVGAFILLFIVGAFFYLRLPE